MTGIGLALKGGASIAGAPLFAPLEMRLEPGRWTCLLGGSGTGKSTILRLIAGLQTGVAFAGHVRAQDDAPLAPRVALMAQDHLLLPWASALENVVIGARLRAQRPDLARGREMLARVGLSGHEGKRPAALSGGQKQRVALARTLMEDRPVILLDEPFSALDARTRGEMQDLAAELLAGRTVLLVTHDPGEAARLGHRILLLSPTGLTEFTPPEGPPPRREDAPDLLRAQAGLLRWLREGV